MKKILLILALALVCSFNANAQQTEFKKTISKGVVTETKSKVSAEPCVTYTAEQALDATTDGNNNTFAAVYSTNATRNCGGKNVEKLPDLSGEGIIHILPPSEQLIEDRLPCCTATNHVNCRHDGCAR